jgi:hypothetical protein
VFVQKKSFQTETVFTEWHLDKWLHHDSSLRQVFLSVVPIVAVGMSRFIRCYLRTNRWQIGVWDISII